MYHRQPSELRVRSVATGLNSLRSRDRANKPHCQSGCQGEFSTVTKSGGDLLPGSEIGRTQIFSADVLRLFTHTHTNTRPPSKRTDALAQKLQTRIVQSCNRRCTFVRSFGAHSTRAMSRGGTGPAAAVGGGESDVGGS